MSCHKGHLYGSSTKAIPKKARRGPASVWEHPWTYRHDLAFPCCSMAQGGHKHGIFPQNIKSGRSMAGLGQTYVECSAVLPCHCRMVTSNSLLLKIKGDMQSLPLQHLSAMPLEYPLALTGAYSTWEVRASRHSGVSASRDSMLTCPHTAQ